MQTVGRLIMLLVGGLAMAAAFQAYRRVLNEAVLDRRYTFSEAEIARGEHCKEALRQSQSPLMVALEERMGDNLDSRVNLTVRKIELGPLRLDGTHRMTVLYNINRIGETVGPAKKATGQVVNSDCSVTVNVFQN